MQGSNDHDDGRPNEFWGSRNRQSDSQHGFGSPEGMELTGPSEQPDHSHAPQANHPGVLPPHTALGNLQALADLDSPSTIFATSPDSEFPTPHVVTPTGRQSPPDMMEQLIGRQPPSPRRDTPGNVRTRSTRGVSPEPATAVQTPEPITRGAGQFDPSALYIRRTQPSRLFANPSPRMTSISPSLQPHMFLGTPTSRSLRHSHVAGRNPHAGYTAGIYGSSFEPAQMGTPGSNAGSVFRRSNHGGIMTQDSYDSSASDSDISVKERLTDQVRSLDELLLSTKKQLGGLSQGSSVNESSLSSHNDNLGQEELDLEDMRRALQQELLEVDYSILEETPEKEDQKIDPPPSESRAMYPDEMLSSSKRLQYDETNSAPAAANLGVVTPTKYDTMSDEPSLQRGGKEQGDIEDMSSTQDDANMVIYAVPASFSVGTLSHSSQRNSSENGSGSSSSRAHIHPILLETGSKNGSIPSQVRNVASSSETSQATIDLESISGDDNSSHPEIFEAEPSLLDAPYGSETTPAEFDSLLGNLPREDNEDNISSHDEAVSMIPFGVSPRKNSERTMPQLSSDVGSIGVEEKSPASPPSISHELAASFDHGETESSKGGKHEIDPELRRIASDNEMMDPGMEQMDLPEQAQVESKYLVEKEDVEKIEKPVKPGEGAMKAQNLGKPGAYDQSPIDTALLDVELGITPAKVDDELEHKIEGSALDSKEDIPLLLTSNTSSENDNLRSLGSDIPKILMHACFWLLFLVVFLAAAGFVVYLTNNDRFAMLPIVATIGPSQSPSFVATFAPSLAATNLTSSSQPSQMPSPSIVSAMPSIVPTSTISSQSPSIFNETSLPTVVPSFLNASSEPSSMPSSSPTKVVVALRTDYEILVVNGTAANISQAAYESDLVESMDNLCLLVEENIQRKLQESEQGRVATVLPTSIREFRSTDCTNPNPLDRCEIVVAEILLENAEGNWEEFLNTLNLAMAIGQLQEELDRVNPNSPVEIIRSIGSSIIMPSISPTQMPSWTWSPSNEPSAALTTPTSLRPIETRTPTAFPTSPPPTPISTYGPSTTPSFQNGLLDFLVSHSYDGGEALMDSLSPQYEAFLWLAMNEKLSEYSEQQLLQRYALATFYYSTDGDNWFFRDDWLSDEDECSWYSKSAKETCSDEGAYVNLELNFNNMNGVLPPELGLLSNSLRRLSLQGGPYRYTGGTIPTELGYLSLLERFFIRNNEYSGTIPSQIGSWSKLKQFDVAFNSLRGNIPTAFGMLQTLTSVDMSANMLAGQIPSEIGTLTKLEKLIVEDNILTGAIPTEIARLTQLHTLRGGSNLLTRLPIEVGELTLLETLSLYQNDLMGTIPTELSQLLELNDLDLSGNGLTGSVPSQLGLLVGIRDQINLSSNKLLGSLSSELGKLEHLRVLRLDSNDLTGPIPSEISGLSSLTTIRLDANNFSGVIPNEVCGTFNETLPSFYGDCIDFDDNCPCCVTCCAGTEESCECRYLGTELEYLCYQQ